MDVLSFVYLVQNAKYLTPDTTFYDVRFTHLNQYGLKYCDPCLDIRNLCYQSPLMSDESHQTFTKTLM